MNTAIIIPAFNPPDTFSSLLKTIQELTNSPIIIIDDGSIVEIKINHSDIIILRNEDNCGKGYSLIKGLQFAQNEGFTHAITLDADSQHDPALIDSFLKIEDDISLVLGIRKFKNNMPFHRKISNKLTSLIISAICRHKLDDSQCGYRRYKLEDVCIESFNEKGFQFESEVLIKLLRSGKTYQNVNIPTIYGQETSSIKKIRDTFKFIRLIVRILIRY